MPTDRTQKEKNRRPSAGDGHRMGTNSLDLDYWKAVVDAIPDGISIHCPETRILHANRVISDVYDVPAARLIGLSCAEAFHKDGIDCPHDQVLKSGRCAEVEGELGLANRLFSVTLSPVLSNGGQPQGYIRIVRDITERQRTQEKLIKAERFATLGQMISGIAHDIGTPLNVISGYCEYLLMRTKPDGQGYKELSTILQQTRRIAEFVRQMLDLARPAQGRADAIGLKGFFAESLELLGHHLRKADVKASLTCKVNPPLIYGDAPRLRQAFFNLLLNACQRVGSGGKLEIIIDEPSDDASFISVMLDGTGRDGDSHDFSESFSGFLNPKGNMGDVGMGLSLAREILDEFGAKVSALREGERAGSLAVYIPKQAGVTGSRRQ